MSESGKLYLIVANKKFYCKNFSRNTKGNVRRSLFQVSRLFELYFKVSVIELSWE